jgi:hypothetical protein
LKFFVKDLFAFRKAQIHRSLIAQKTSALNLVYFETLSSIELLMKSLEVNNEIDFKLFEKFELYSKNFELHLSNKQIIEMQSYNSVFGKDEQALARILSRIFLRHFFRSGVETEETVRSNAIPSAQFGLREV